VAAVPLVSRLKLVAVLRVVLLAMDAARLLVRFVLQMSTFALRHDAIRLRSVLGTVQMNLSGREAMRLAHRELAVLHAVHDPFALVMLALVVPRRAGRCRAREDHRGQSETGYEVDLLHRCLLFP
jgi:hypothetical protein